MILGLDIGNTNIVLGVFDQERLKVCWRISTNRNQTSDEYGMIIKNLFTYTEMPIAEITAVIISSVVPPLMPEFEKMSRKYFGVKPLVIGPGVKTGMPIKYENPREVGADRIVNAVAGYEMYGGPLILVDFGTAITFCAVSEKGEYLGGAIAPGIGISTEALFSKAAKLPRVELVKPQLAVGKNTVVSMQSGIVFGFVGLVQEMIKRFKRELGASTFVVATGGHADMIAKETRAINKVDHTLTLHGLRIIYERNK